MRQLGAYSARDQVAKQGLGNREKSSKHQPGQSVVGLLKPEACPVDLIRIGGNSDGAYLVPNDLDSITACFSPGVCRSKTFEDELATNYGIRSHLCDFSSNTDLLETKLVDGLQTFQQLWLDLKSTPSSISLEDWTRQHASGSDDLLLQMDIEGAEIRNILQTPQRCLDRFRIIVIELHNLEILEKQGSWKWRIKVLLAMAWCYRLRPLISPFLHYRPISHWARVSARWLEPYLVGQLLLKLTKNHRCVHAHANNNSHYVFIDPTTGMNIPSLLELTFLRKDRFKGPSETFRSPQIPHPQDIFANAPDHPELSLNQAWL